MRAMGRRAGHHRPIAITRSMALHAMIVAAVAAPAPPPSGAVYLQSTETAGADPEGWISFTGLNLEMYPKSSLTGRVPFLLVPAANSSAGGFHMQNLWHGYSESRYGDFVSVSSARDLVLIPASADASSR